MKKANEQSLAFLNVILEGDATPKPLLLGEVAPDGDGEVTKQGQASKHKLL